MSELRATRLSHREPPPQQEVPVIAAIYARKSTEQHGIADEAKSVTRQIDHARAYAARKGWMVADAHIYVDDGISGAEFANRPGFLRLMNALKPAPPFQVLVMSEESRLGREAIETAYALKQLVTAGVRVFFYLEDRERTLNSPMEKAMLSLQTMADEMEREKARQRVTDAMVRRAQAGQVTGAAPFGYVNADVLDAVGQRAHVERVINPTEAAIVRRIFALSAAGTGYTRIAKLLNAEHAPAPRPKGNRPAGWSPSTVKVILDRRLYLGEAVWNRSQKRNGWGEAAWRRRPESEWIRSSVPALRIVSDAEWRAAHSRLDGVRASLQAVGAAVGNRRPRDIESAYLLSGFARCAVCGGTLSVLGGSHRNARGHAYGCLAYHKRGTVVCPNHLKLPIARVHDAVLQEIDQRLRRGPALFMAILDGVLANFEPRAATRALRQHRAEVATLDREIARFVKAVAVGDDVEPLVTELRVRQVQRKELQATIAAYEAGTTRIDRRGIEQAVREECAAWRALLASEDIAEGRQMLRRALTGPMSFQPDGDVYRFSGALACGALLAGRIRTPGPVAEKRSRRHRRSPVALVSLGNLQ
jgi:DNA invertase Pin-like site-specific DNA recombinase